MTCTPKQLSALLLFNFVCIIVLHTSEDHVKNISARKRLREKRIYFKKQKHFCWIIKLMIVQIKNAFMQRGIRAHNTIAKRRKICVKVFTRICFQPVRKVRFNREQILLLNSLFESVIGDIIQMSHDVWTCDGFAFLIQSSSDVSVEIFWIAYLMLIAISDRATNNVVRNDTKKLTHTPVTGRSRLSRLELQN